MITIIITTLEKGEKPNETLCEKERPRKNIKKKPKLRLWGITNYNNGCSKTKITVICT